MLYELYISQSILNLEIVFLKHDYKPFDYSHNGTSHIYLYVYPSSEIKGYTSKLMMSHVVPTGSLLHCTSFLKQISSLI